MPLIVIVLIAGDEGGYVCDSSNNSGHFIMILKIAVILMELLITVIAMLMMITFMIAGATSR